MSQFSRDYYDPNHPAWSPPSKSDDSMNGTDDALDRMARAAKRGTGCHLTAEMIASLRVSVIGQIWEEERPARRSPTHTE